MKTALFLLLVSWPAFVLGAGFGPLAERGRPVAVDVQSQHVFQMKWRQPVVRVGAFRGVVESLGTPAAIPGAQQIVVATGEGEVRSYSMTDGELQWRMQFDTDFETTVVPFSSSKDLPWGLVVDRKGLARALDLRSGSIVWTADLKGDCRSPVAIHGKRIIATTANNKVVALDKDTGEVLWSKGRAKPAGLTIMGHGSPVVSNKTVFAGFSDGYLEAFAIETGKKLWQRPLSLRDAEFRDANATPVVHKGVLYAASYSDGILAMDPKTGKVLWQIPAPSVTSLAAGSDRLFAASADGYIWGLRASDGELLFRTQLEAGPALGLRYTKGYLVLSGGVSGLVVLSSANGAPLQATSLGSRAASAPAVSGQEIALLSAEGYLYSFSSERPR